MKTINKFKIALVTVGMLTIGSVSAQTVDPTTLTKDADPTKVVKLVDNKGTIKFLQSNNGITQITSTAPGNRTVTTWQLGGTLTDNTYITADTAKEFALDGLELVTTSTASTNAVDREDHDGDPGAGGTGYTVLIRDEDSGAIQKIKVSDLLEVETIGFEYTQGADAAANVDITVVDLPIIDLAKSRKLFVFRNGVKLRWAAAAAKDFNGDTAGQITINYDAADLPMYAGDIIEIQYIK